MTLLFRALLALATALALVGVTLALPSGFITCLQSTKASSNSYFFTPSSSMYQNDRFSFNLVFDYHPTAIYHPATNQDAAAAIRCAATYKVPIAPRSGGHSFEGYSMGGRDGALVIDLDQFQHFSLDPATKVASVGAGTRLGSLHLRLWQADQHLVPAGSCPSVGIGGHALGGGMGFVSRHYGMLSDNLVGMTLIDADGTIRQVSATQDPDLFWALRGAGGGNFGLVTEFQIQAHKAPATITTLRATFPSTKFQTLVRALEAWAKEIPDSVTPIMMASKSAVILILTLIGTEAQGKELMRGFWEHAGQPSKATWQAGTWYDAISLWARMEGGTLEEPLVSPKLFLSAHSLVYRKPISDRELDILEQHIVNPPRLDDSSDGGTSGSGNNTNSFAPAARVLGSAIFEIWGGQVGQSKTPSVLDHHRGALYSVQYSYEWILASDEVEPGKHQCTACLEVSAAWAQEMQTAYKASNRGGEGAVVEAYQNYIEHTLPDHLAAYYGAANVPRLQQIKRTVDPNNVFTFPRGITLPTTSS